MSDYRLDPQVQKYMEEHGVTLDKACNQLGINLDEAYERINNDEDNSDE